MKLCDVYIKDDVPKVQLSEDCPVTDSFRLETNLWLRNFFGLKPAIPDGEVQVAGNRWYANPRTYVTLKEQFRSKG